MKKGLTIFAAIALVAILTVPAAAQSFGQVQLENGAVLQYVEGELLVGTAPHVTHEMMGAAAALRGCTVVEQGTSYHKLRIPEGADPIALAQDFAADAGCEWASPNFVTHVTGAATFNIPPNDPFYGFQTHLSLINIEAAWAIEAGDPGVVVSVIDSGVAYENRPIPAYELPGVVAGATNYVLAPDLAQTSFVPGYDFWYDDAFPNDDRFHGTAVAAVISQDTDNGIRTAGVAPGVSIMPVKSNNFNGSGTLATLIDSVNFSTANGADVINMSLGFPSFATDPVFDSFFAGLDAALAAAHDAGIVVVASSGNDGTGLVSRPAANGDVIAVGASNLDGLTRTSYSQFSADEPALGVVPAFGLPGQIELVAPVGAFQDLDGNGIPDSVIQETIGFRNPETFGAFLLTGTSFSSPQVAALAALMISNGQLPSKDGYGVDILRQVMRETATDLGAPGDDLEFGAGQIDAAAALAATQVNVCKVPPGNPANAHQIRVSIHGARAHLVTGSYLGSCN